MPATELMMRELPATERPRERLLAQGGLLGATPESLRRQGLGLAKAASLWAAVELGRRLARASFLLIADLLPDAVVGLDRQKKLRERVTAERIVASFDRRTGWPRSSPPPSRANLVKC